LLDLAYHLLKNLFKQTKCEYKNEEELLEFRRNPDSEFRFFGLKANALFGLLSAVRGPPGM
jgi:hypothetical protein